MSSIYDSSEILKDSEFNTKTSPHLFAPVTQVGPKLTLKIRLRWTSKTLINKEQAKLEEHYCKYFWKWESTAKKLKVKIY